MARPETVETIPLTILTGFLGAGKTTLLNRVLAAQHRRRVAVVVNELGKIDIDAGLIRTRAGDVMELAGGCVCHQLGVQRELWSALEDIVARSRPDVVILETSGIAEPGEIIRRLAEWQTERGDGRASGAVQWTGELRTGKSGMAGSERRFTMPVAAVVAVVDAEAGAGQLERYPEAREQIVCADRLLLSKTDLATASAIGHLHGVLAGLNRSAERAAFPDGAEGTAALIPWLFDAGAPRAPERQSGTADGHHHHHDARQLVAASYVDEVPLIAEALRLTCERFEPRLVRIKGWVNIAGDSRRGFLERAGCHTELRFGEPWGAGEARITRLVLIGEALDEASIRRQLWACRSAGSAEQGGGE
jgi:cobalamin biosynthesis protein CobW